MRHKMPTVRANHAVPAKANIIQPNIVVGPRKLSRVIDHNTSDNCAWASERAQRRRYDAVCEIHPRQNSMV